MTTLDRLVSSNRCNLTRKGQEVLDNYCVSMRSSDLSDIVKYESIKSCIFGLIREFPLPKVRLLKLADVLSLKRVPDFSSSDITVDSNITVDANSIDRENSFVVYVSRAGERKNLSAEFKNDLFKLCAQGLNKIKQQLPTLEVYLWLDYGCMNLDNTAIFDEFDRVMQWCDCIFTPIVEDTDMYFEQAWCRMETVFGAIVPINSNTAGELKISWKNSMVECTNQGQLRPHFMFSMKELQCNTDPVLVSPTQYSRDCPLAGYIHNAWEYDLISRMMSGLQPFIANHLNSFGASLLPFLRSTAHLADAVKSSNIENLRIFYGEGAEVDGVGNYLLIEVIRYASLEAVIVVLNFNVNVNCRGFDGSTPLIWAVKLRRQDVVALLLAKNADRTLKDNDGNLALHYARKERWDDIIALLSSGQSSLSEYDSDNELAIYDVELRAKKYKASAAQILRTTPERPSTGTPDLRYF